MISLIVAKTANGIIGANNDLPWYLSADLKRFKELTTDQTVVMGRKTYESIVARLGHGLPNRRNVVLTRQSVVFPDAEVIHSLDDIAQFENVFIIGGAEVYQAAIDRADRLYVTEVHADVDGDAYFPAIDLANWHETSREAYEKDEKNDYNFDFVVYEKQ